MKKESRILGIDDAPFDKFSDKTAGLIGVMTRGSGRIDSILSTKVDVDGTDATSAIAVMVNGSRNASLLKAIFLDGIAVAGFNVIDIQDLYKKTCIPVIVIMRSMPDIKGMLNALEKIGKSDSKKLIEKAGNIYPFKAIYFQKSGIGLDEAREILSLSISSANIPEPLRIAHMIGQGIMLGESRTRA